MITDNIFKELIFDGISFLSQKNLLNWVSDEKYLKIRYKLACNQRLNLENPVSFNEKLQWLKIHNRQEEYHQMVDKHDAKEYVSKLIGEEYVIPLLGVWDSFDEIDFDKLPNQFVLKPSHASGGVFVCKDKSTFDFKKAKKKLKKYLSYDYYNLGREWPYKGLKRRIIAEQYMVDESGCELKDYKFFCFNGKVEFMFISKGRTTNEEMTFDFFDRDFNHLPITKGHPNSKVKIEKPQGYEEMVNLAEKMSKGFPHLRVDFYNINGNIYFGEFTFFSAGGMTPFEPEEWNKKFGDLIDLSLVK